MPQSVIAEGLILVSDTMLSNIEWFVAIEKGQRDRLADYCEKIADCLSRGCNELKTGFLPHGCCAEMDSYMCHLHETLEKNLKPEEFARLFDALVAAYDMERLHKYLIDAPEDDTKLAELDMVAKKFTDLAKKLRL
jgi:hypothetical protein